MQIDIQPVSKPETILEIEPLNTAKDIEQVFDRFLAEEVGRGRASIDTLRTYKTQIKLYLQWCLDNNLAPVDVDRQGIIKYRQYLVNKEYATKTIELKLNVVRRFYTALLDNNLIQNNPAKNVQAPLEAVDPAANLNYLDEDELLKLLKHLNQDIKQAQNQKQRLIPLRDRSIIEIMALEGCRKVEMHRLQVNQIVRRDNNVGLKINSKRSVRVVPLTPTLNEHLEEYLETRRSVFRRKIRPDSYLFVSLSNRNKGGQLSRSAIHAMINNKYQAIGFREPNTQKKTPHSLRHTAATQALRAGADQRQVQDLLGHKDPRTTAIYSHVGDRWENNPAAMVEKKLDL